MSDKAHGHSRIRQTRADNLFDAVNVSIMFVLLVIMVYPLIYVVSCSFSDPLLVVQSKIALFPKQVTLQAYERVFRNELIVSGYRNTILYTLLGTLTNVLLTTITAYPLSRKDFGAKKPLTVLFTWFLFFTMLFSGGMVPTFLTVKQLGLLDNIWALILPGAINVWNLFIMKNYFQTSIPGELYEAAMIDGADNFYMLRAVVLPLCAPIMAVMVLYYGVSHWNAYFNAMIYLQDKSKYPLQLFLREILLTSSADNIISTSGGSTNTVALAETIKYATIVISTAPILCIYPFIQRYFVTGVMIGGVKE